VRTRIVLAEVSNRVSICLNTCRLPVADLGSVSALAIMRQLTWPVCISLI